MLKKSTAKQQYLINKISTSPVLQNRKTHVVIFRLRFLKNVCKILRGKYKYKRQTIKLVTLMLYLRCEGIFHRKSVMMRIGLYKTQTFLDRCVKDKWRDRCQTLNVLHEVTTNRVTR